MYAVCMTFHACTCASSINIMCMCMHVYMYRFVFDDLSSTDTEDDFNGIISYKHGTMYNGSS